MDEFSGPSYYDCPKKVLNVLSETDNQWANDWRKRCIETSKMKRDKNRKLKDLPIGTRIKFEIRGKTLIVEKKRPMYQFKHPWYKVCGEDCYIKQKSIPENFEIVN